jgi:hypothetical protein
MCRKSQIDKRRKLTHRRLEKLSNLASRKYLGRHFLTNTSLFRITKALPEGSHVMVDLQFGSERIACIFKANEGLSLLVDEQAVDVPLEGLNSLPGIAVGEGVGW